MSDSESHDMDEQPIIYEQEEVLWAKIRGYPWWPAFVDKVHGAKPNSDDEIEYTVFFFGDNTHSRLGGSKLRRFLDYYTQFFPKAKTNRKLYLSIMKAEEKLKQNGGNIDIFETLRNSMKKPKKGRGHKTQSRIDSQQPANHISDQPQLVRNKTFPHTQQKQRKQRVSQQQGVSQDERPRRRGRKSRKVVQQQEKQQQHIYHKSESEQSIHEEKVQKQQIELPKALTYRTRSGRNRKETSMVDQNNEEKQQQPKQSESQSENQQTNKKAYPLRFANKTKPLSRGAPKKRGRPKKIVEDNNQSESQESQQQHSQNSQPKHTPQVARAQSELENRKLRNERILPIKNQPLRSLPEKQKHNLLQTTQKCETSEQTKQLILERVKFCLDKRSELIEYLDELTVTADIVKEILDLDVTTVLLEGGETTAESIRVLQKLKSALLHRYFPDDIKIRKKYEKLGKKSHSLKTNNTQNEESLEDLELRRKTLIKLEKILKNLDEGNDQKERAIEVESYFRRNDESIGTGYKTMAYKVLRSLKDRSVGVDEVVPKLQGGEFDEDQK